MAERLSELLGQEVIFARDIVGEDAKAKAAALQGGQIMLLENLRFDAREEKNDPEFAKELASMAELYVSDAFGTVHRAHASTAGVAAYLPAVSGLLVAKELEVMGGALNDPKRPFVAVLSRSTHRCTGSSSCSSASLLTPPPIASVSGWNTLTMLTMPQDR